MDPKHIFNEGILDKAPIPEKVVITKTNRGGGSRPDSQPHSDSEKNNQNNEYFPNMDIFVQGVEKNPPEVVTNHRRGERYGQNRNE